SSHFHSFQSIVYFFFFSSRRRHTRFSRDWSSDVCSSDLPPEILRTDFLMSSPENSSWPSTPRTHCSSSFGWRHWVIQSRRLRSRSEERRVGKECRSGGSREH